MLFSTITTALLFAASATAAALPRPAKPQYAPARNLNKLAKLFPQSALQGPGDLDLKYVVLGIGTQNYTCGSDESAAPGTTGAFGKNPLNLTGKELTTTKPPYTISVRSSTTKDMPSGRFPLSPLLHSHCTKWLLG